MLTKIYGLFLILFLTIPDLQAAICSPRQGELVGIVLGDWSGDGHDKTEKYLICSNLNSAAISSAYVKATRQIGYDFQQTIAAEYEDRSFSKEKLQQLRKLGLKIMIEDEDSFEGNSVDLTPEAYLAIWLGLIKLGNSDFSHHIINPTTTIQAGGYGLFY